MAGGIALRCFGRCEDHTDAVVELLRQFDPERRTYAPQERVRYLHQNSGTISGVRLTAGSAAVIKINQDFKRLADYLVGFFPLHIGDKTDAAGVMLELRIVKSLLDWWSVTFHGGYL